MSINKRFKTICDKIDYKIYYNEELDTLEDIV